MSWSGYYQILCKNGHLNECDGYDEPNLGEDDLETFYGVVQEPWTCRHCSAKADWWNVVHTTNGFEEEEETRVSLSIKTKEIREQCNLGHWHVVKEATYEIPEKQGHFVGVNNNEQGL